MHHASLYRPRPDDADFYHQIVEFTRLQTRQHGHLRARFDLEDAHRICLADHVIGLFIFRRNILHPEQDSTSRGNQIQRAANGGEHAQREHVDFHQPYRVQIVLVPLDDAAVRHGGIFDGNDTAQLVAGNDKAAYMLRQMARIAIQESGQRNQLLDNRAVGIEAVFGQALADFRAVVPPGKRAGQPPDAFEIQAEGLADILDRRAGAVGDDRCSDGGAVLAIFLIDILDDFFPALMLEIDIDIGNLVSLPGNKPLEQQIAALPDRSR